MYFHEMKFGTECGEHLNTLKDIHHILVQIQISNVEATYVYDITPQIASIGGRLSVGSHGLLP